MERCFTDLIRTKTLMAGAELTNLVIRAVETDIIGSDFYVIDSYMPLSRPSILLGNINI